MPNNWTDTEVEAAVEDYFNMLRLELSGKKYNKTEHRRDLLEKLNNRSHGSVELKHQNISAVLIEMGIPYIDGYKPRFNYQRSLLPGAVTDYLKNNPDIKTLFAEDARMVPTVPTVDDLLTALEDPPEKEIKEGLHVAEQKAIYNPTGENYLKTEAHNIALGDAGEQFVLNFERARLMYAGKHSLADRIEQVSKSIGPSEGYDIRSYEENGKDRFIEAKTTKHGKDTPFFVTPNELRCSQENSSRYFLYRIFGFRKVPRLFKLQGHLNDVCTLEPSEFIAKVI